MADDAKQLKDDLEELRQLGSKLGKSIDFSNLKNDAESVKELLKAWKKEADELNREFNDLSSTFKNVLNDLTKTENTTGNINKSFKTLGGLADKLKYDAEDISKLNKKDLETLEKKAQIEISNLKTSKEALDISVKQRFKNLDNKQIASIGARTKDKNLAKEIAQYIELNNIFGEGNNFKEDENNYVQKLLTLTQERLEEEEKVRKNLGLTGALYKGLSSTLQKLGVDSTIIEGMGKKLDEAAKTGKVGFNELSKVIKGGLTEAFQDPLFRFALGLKMVKSGFNDIKKAFNIFLEYDKIFVDTARNLGLSEEKISGIVAEAKAADTAIKGINGQTFDTLYTAAQLAKSFAEVNNQLGLSVDIGAKSLDEFTAMTNQMGLSADEATNIYKIGLLNNMSLEDTNKAIISGVVATQKSTGVQVNARQVLQEIGKLSAGITSKFQQNPAALAQAVTQAKALGTTLEQVDKVGESLLNFESSIENELKAELLTGKQINLEKARYAALTGDQATLTQELANQVGSLADFQGMNVIAQKSLAEAFGLSRDEVADMLTKQETFNKLGDVSKKSAAEQLAIAKERGLSETDSLVVNLKQQATSEKIAAAFDNFKSAIADVLIGLKPLLDMFVELSKNTGLVYTGLALIAGISFAKTIGGLVLMASQLGFISLAKAAGAGADGASATAIGAQATATSALAGTEAIITGEKVAGAAADTTSVGAMGAQTIAAGTLAGTEAIITGEKVAGAAADTTSVGAMGAQTIAAGTLAGTEAIITGEKIAQAAASSIINPIVAVAGMVAAAAAVAFIVNAAMKKPKLEDGAVVMPTPDGTDVTIGEAGSPEAVIPLNSPKAGEMLGINKPSSTSTSIDLSPVINIMNEVKNAISSLANRPIYTTITLDGRALGTAVGSQIETGTAQMMNTSYKVA